MVNTKEHLEKQFIWLKRGAFSAWQNLMRNKILSSATIFVIALMFFVFNLVLAISVATESVIDRVGEKVDISIEIQSGVENYTIQTFADNLRKRDTIKEVIYVSKEDALSRFGSKYPHVISFLDHNKLDNPLPDIVRIVSTDVSNNNKIISYLEGIEFSRVVNQEKLKANTEQKTRNEKILDITHFIKKSGIWLNIIFAFVAILIIFNSININIHAHQREIHIMKLVGAKHSFIRSGFIFEGIYYATFALIISSVLSRIVLSYLAKKLLGIISNESMLSGLNAILLQFEDKFFYTFSSQFIIAVFVGIISSYLAIELYLRKKQSF